ncbi:MAG: HAMP domain-containing sensor histidine kinase [Paenibacillus macerans]|uniref:histidine kinase n=1 Tax=Paenibacillus macerans TaxID=44252 RepID=A0A6N8ET31_PAEMA|nr:HAMP domain-containing sensor histidine kinase [Paenibacillus macerans]MBS5909286.1 HAMP domain-containing histidine kinase [Paenibacillus macerans]MDU7475563.1 HAMP domain-containing sensor histidine kinase [Paenibacillus macerans]MEC0140544.1 HAMP domain-containing sensor histidine kinase [Paenibacillus macerans]MEC0330280.1 HAMP domain-containing sensor histidine kinase [Paenibacillus macerans]MUG21950.1 HAMP domain-containing protein [Paenibacillus macerans]
MKWTIQFKMVSLFSVIVFIGFSSLLILSNKVGEENMYREVHEDMIQVKKNLDIALNQYFLIHNKRLNEKSLEAGSRDLEEQIGAAAGGKVTLYHPDASPYNASSSPAVIASERPDIQSAANSQIAYSTSMQKGKLISSLSFPVMSGRQVIGIIQLEKNYTELFKRHLRFQNTVKYLAAVIFVFVFIASVFISRQITRPVRVLTKRAVQVAQGNLNADVNISTKDEIGELASSFNVMINRVREQIDVIERERDEVKQVQARSKLFFDNVTHELKTPLTTILGYAQILRDNGFTDKAFFDKGLDYIINESRRLNAMVADILEFSVASAAMQAYRFERIDVSKVVREACEDMAIKAGKYNIAIHYELEENLHIQGDRHKLKEAFLNVLDNSVKYGYVNSMIEVRSFRSGNSAYIVISDQGEGISEEALKHVLEPFYRVNGVNRKERGSAGLGLSIVKNTIEQHGGTIQMLSAVNLGTQVHIHLPGEWPA